MHKYRLCQKLFDNALPPSLHKKRKACLLRFTASLLDYDIRLSLTEIANHLDTAPGLLNSTTLKHKIKATDTFLGNQHFMQQIPLIYRGFAHHFFSGYKELIILVDWSGACGPNCFALQASVAAHGRSIPIYTEVHDQSQQENKVIHAQFLLHLKQVLPEHIKVTVVTDAGFHRDWFAQVVKLGWDFVGRVYSRYLYKPEYALEWKSVGDIDPQHVAKAQALGAIKLGKTKQPLACFLYTYKEKLSGKPHKKNLYPSHEKAFSDAYRHPWVIASSLEKNPAALIACYKKRMQIEENFRDIKNEQLGLGLRRNCSSGLIRITMLFFLATLLILLLWWFGLIVETQGHHRHYQPNTVKHKRVISFIRLARLVLRHDPTLITYSSLNFVIAQLRENYFTFLSLGSLECTKK